MAALKDRADVDAVYAERPRDLGRNHDMFMKPIYPFLILCAAVSVADACNIPVFRYALERWRPDECEVIVFYQQALTPQQESVLKDAIPGSGERQDRSSEAGTQPAALLTGGTQSAALLTGGTQSAGARVVRVDVDHLETPYRALWSQLANDGSEKQLPHVVVRVNVGTARTVNAWHGPLASVRNWDVFHSPARGEMAKRLLSGHSVVWLVIKSDDADRNAKVRDLLKEQLDQLADTVQLPDGIGLPGSELYSEIPLLVKFSVLEVDRNDPKEKFLVDLFSSFRQDAVTDGEPLVIPVFGRGRALEVIPASELNPRLLADLAAFLSGACSCQVKEQNPGFDLLLSVDWNTELFGEGFEPPPAKTVEDRGRPQLLTIPPGR